MVMLVSFVLSQLKILDEQKGGGLSRGDERQRRDNIRLLASLERQVVSRILEEGGDVGTEKTGARMDKLRI